MNLSPDEELAIYNYWNQYRDYIRSLNSPLLKPTPNLLERQPVDPDELEETKALIDYERQLAQSVR